MRGELSRQPRETSHGKRTAFAMRLRIWHDFRERVDHHFWGGEAPAGVWGRLVGVGRLLYLVARKSSRDLTFERAASLAFASSLSLIPLGVILIMIFHGLFDFDARLSEFREYIVSLVAEESRSQVARWLAEIESGLRAPLENTSAVTPIAVAGLLIAGMTLYRSAERNFSVVWEVPVTRTFFQRLATFWLLLTAVPFVLGLAFGPGLSQAAAEVQAVEVQVSWVRSVALPGLISFLGFAILFTVLPNARVKIHAAALGALFSSIVWLAGTQAFTYYVQHLANQSIYGALGVLPFGLLYLFYSWVVALVGAQLAFCFQNYVVLAREMRRMVGAPRLSAGGAAVALTTRFYRALREPGAPPKVGDIADAIGYPAHELIDIAQRLERAGYLALDDQHRVTPTVAPDLLTPADVVLALNEPRLAPETGTPLAEFLAGVDREITTRLREKSFADFM